jgi:TolA-binding protein
VSAKVCLALIAVGLGSIIDCLPASGQSTVKSPLTAKTNTPPRKLTEAERQAQAVLNAYTDAANFQNSGAYPLAIEAWQKLLQAFPKDALASKAKHYLGICFLQLDKPDYEQAIQYLRAALEDQQLDVREEGLVKLGQALYESGQQAAGDTKNQRYQEATKVFATFLDEYADGSFADQAIYYAAECEYHLGRLDKAAAFYRKLTDQAALAKSEWRPDAMFSLGVIYQQQQQPKLATEAFEGFLKGYPQHRLADDVRLRLAESYLSLERAGEAAEILRKMSEVKDAGGIQDYILYRYAYALAKAGKYAESSAVYQELSRKFPQSKYASGASLAAGQTLMRDKQYTEAAAYFRQLLPQRSDTAAEAAHLLCQIAVIQGKATDSISIARDALTWATQSPRYVDLKMDLAEGLILTEDGQIEARQLYEQIATEHADSPLAPRATYNAAFTALQAGAFAEAQRWGELFARNFPQDPLAADVAYIAAEATLQRGQHAEAATAFEQLLKSQPENPGQEGWELRLGQALYLGGQLDQAFSRMRQLAKSSKDPEVQAEAHFLVGASQLKSEQYPEAIEALTSSLQASPRWKQADEAHLLLSQAQLKAGDTSAAKDTLSKLVGDFPDSRLAGQAQLRLGQLWAAAGDHKLALASYQKILDSGREKPLQALAAYGKAWVLMQQEKYADALPLLEPLTTSERADSMVGEALLAKAICLRQTEQYGAAIAMLEPLATEPNPSVSLTKSLYELGLCYLEAKKLEQASATFDRLMKEFPQLPDMDKVLYEYAWSLKEQQLMEPAAGAFTKLSESYPESSLAAEADYHLGQLAYDEQEFPRAVSFYSKAASRTRDEGLLEKSLYKLGWSYYQQQDLEQAASQFARQIQVAPEGVLAIEGRFMQAECLFKREDYTAAFELYRQARKDLESRSTEEGMSLQARTLCYLHGAQSARELKKWKDVDEWLAAMRQKFSDSEYIPFADYERAYSAQAQGKKEEALRLYQAVAENNRNEIGARSRFMMGELYFAEKDFGRAVPEFEKVLYGFGAQQAPPEIRNWQARAALEAGRCSEVLISNLTGPQRAKAIQIAQKFYQTVVQDYPQHELVPQAQTRLDELKKMSRP